MKIAANGKIWALISLVIILIGVITVATVGFNFGIDFTGGTLLQLDLERTFELERVDEILAPYELDPTIIYAGAERTEVIIKTKASLSNDERNQIFLTLKDEYQFEGDQFLDAEQISPVVGKEIQQKAIYSILFASVGMLIYIWWRFEISFGISAIVALFHDVFMLLTLYAVFQIPINQSFIAALLLIVGYSINDTIVVFDRIRENVSALKKESPATVADTSLRESLSRTINTSVTTLLLIGTLFFFGNELIRELALPLMAGVFFGTYSSIFIASPTWAFIRKRAKVK